MNAGRDQVVVHLDAAELGERRAVGALSRERAGTQSVVSFAYEGGWIAANDSFPLDPSLPLYEGDQFTSDLPGILADASPDRWGRTLLERREALAARREERERHRLDEWDFLVGVNDETRMGALRLASSDGGAYLDDEPLAVPPATRLRELEHWAREVEQGLPDLDGEEERWIAMLVAPGSSLGGARPKASFSDEDGSLWIAKFPSREDRYDLGAWEQVVARLSAAAGIAVPGSKLLKLGSPYRTHCARRFDREGGSRRLYASAMTLAGRRDGEEGAGYLDVAQAIESFGDPDAIEADLEQLFRRVVFNVLVSNHDDHLRNHGFLRERSGWRLAPAFDVNPSPFTEEHSLSLDGEVRVPDLDAVRATAPLFRLREARVAEIVAQVGAAVAAWRQEATAAGLPRDELDLMAIAFERAGG